jgi:hypothetical protein
MSDTILHWTVVMIQVSKQKIYWLLKGLKSVGISYSATKRYGSHHLNININFCLMNDVAFCHFCLKNHYKRRQSSLSLSLSPHIEFQKLSESIVEKETWFKFFKTMKHHKLQRNCGHSTCRCAFHTCWEKKKNVFTILVIVSKQGGEEGVKFSKQLCFRIAYIWHAV